LFAATRSIIEILILIISLLTNRLNLDSTNSSKPPSSDPNRKKKRKKKTGKKAGGQKGHVGTTLKMDCMHALCNAHHLRELTRAWEQDGQQWAQKLKNLLETINRKVTDAGGALDAKVKNQKNTG